MTTQHNPPHGTVPPPPTGAPATGVPQPQQQPPPPPPPSGPQVVQANTNAQDGLAKCPRCGSTAIRLNTATSLLRCAYCRHEWTGHGEGNDDLFINQDIRTLSGMVLGAGSQDIAASTQDVVTFKCTACGAAVAVDTAPRTQARRRRGRHPLSTEQ